MDIIKNPVIIGVFVGVVVYIYMSWVVDKKNKKNKNKDNKKEETVNLLVPLAAAVITWFIVYSYTEQSIEIPKNAAPPANNMPSTTGAQQSKVGGNVEINSPKNTFRFIENGITSSSDPKSFSMLPTNGGISVPSNLSALPDIMMEIYDN